MNYDSMISRLSSISEIRNSMDVLEEEKIMLMVMKQKRQLKIIHNNITLLIILNIASLLVFIFSIIFYQWYELQILLNRSNGSTGASGVASGIWLNMLYVFNDEGEYMTFKSYMQSKYFICNDKINKDFCVSQFDNMEMVGQATFGLLVFGGLLQGIDLYRLIRLRALEGRRTGIIKAFWLHPSIILLYFSGYSVYFAEVFFSEMGSEEFTFQLSDFGFSFWIGLCSIPIYIILAVYYRKIKNKLQSQELVDNLINNITTFEKTLRKQVSNKSSSLELSSKSSQETPSK